MSDEQMRPLSGEPVEVDGVYSNEWGREEAFRRGDIFPADPQLGTTSWKLVSYAVDNHAVETDLPLHHDGNNESGPAGTRMQIDRGDK